MKKLIYALSAVAAFSAVAVFLFYFFKINPQYRPKSFFKEYDY